MGMTEWNAIAMPASLSLCQATESHSYTKYKIQCAIRMTHSSSGRPQQCVEKNCLDRHQQKEQWFKKHKSTTNCCYMDSLSYTMDSGSRGGERRVAYGRRNIFYCVCATGGRRTARQRCQRYATFVLCIHLFMYGCMSRPLPRARLSTLAAKCLLIGGSCTAGSSPSSLDGVFPRRKL